jgi:DNA replication protein DnaC
MTVDHETLTGWLTRLQLTAIRDQLDNLIDEAARRELTLREALFFLIEREIARKGERRIEMAGKIAHFPCVRDLDGFDFSAQPSLDPRQIRELAACRWVAHGEALLLLGPPGVCKTHLAIALGRAAIPEGYSVLYVTARRWSRRTPRPARGAARLLCQAQAPDRRRVGMRPRVGRMGSIK